MAGGALVVVGTGIQIKAHLTVQAEAFIRDADKVFYIIPDRLGDDWLPTLNPTAESLRPFYINQNRRLDTYQAMVAHILTAVRQKLNVCAVFYGHPGVFTLPAHEAIKQAKAEGFRAWMCPAVSAEDCLFADLSIDPATTGCQTYEATYFLIHQPQIETSSTLILWQIGAIGNTKTPDQQKDKGMQILAGQLQQLYPSSHIVTVYEAPLLAGYAPRVQIVKLEELGQTAVTSLSTLYIPPSTHNPPNQTMMKRLGLTPQDVIKNW